MGHTVEGGRTLIHTGHIAASIWTFLSGERQGRVNLYKELLSLNGGTGVWVNRLHLQVLYTARQKYHS